MKTFQMKALHYLVLLVLLSISCSVRAQISLHVDPNALDSLGSRTFALGTPVAPDTVPFNIWVYNQSGVQFTDSLAFGYAVTSGGFINTGVSYNNNVVSGPVSFPWTGVSIGPQSGILLRSVVVNFTDPPFTVGSSTVVIWPLVSAHSGVTVDSARSQITITAPTGVTDEQMKRTKVFLSGSQLYVHSPENISGDIRIYDITGRVVSVQKLYQNTPVSMSQYAPGTYAVEVTLSDGRRGVYKVLNEVGR